MSMSLSLSMQRAQCFCTGLSFFSLAWRRPTFPGVCTPSIIGAGGLNGRVRDGYACVPSAMATRLWSSICVVLLRHFLRSISHVPRTYAPSLTSVVPCTTRILPTSLSYILCLPDIFFPTATGEALDQFVSVCSTYHYASTPDRSTLSSSRGLTSLTEWDTLS